MNIGFYQLQSAEATGAVLARLLQKSRDAEKTIRVVAPEVMLASLSQAIWSEPADSWLPHGIKGRDDDARDSCPIWLADDDTETDIKAEFYMYLGDKLPAPEILVNQDTGRRGGVGANIERLFILFDGKDAAQLTAARESWRAWKEAGHTLTYFAQDASGAWVKK